MAASRKLQGEIDRCLKKVSEGVETFEDIWQKVHNATNSNQKEKYEADLKKEIKKLQRLRDQIKSWIASSEIKDKTNLMDYRKLIETQMERFKVVERETKTKAYSKEGLGAAQKLDPAQKEREQTSIWLVQCIDTLNLQVDKFESEMELLVVGGKKKRVDRDKQDRIDGLKMKLEKHRYHIKKLETLLRMLDNMSIEPGEIMQIKDDLEYYIEVAPESEPLDNEFIYDDLFGPNNQNLSEDGDALSTSTENTDCAAVSPATTSAACNAGQTNIEAAPDVAPSAQDESSKKSKSLRNTPVSSSPVQTMVIKPTPVKQNATAVNNTASSLLSSVTKTAVPASSTVTAPVTTSSSSPAGQTFHHNSIPISTSLATAVANRQQNNIGSVSQNAVVSSAPSQPGNFATVVAASSHNQQHSAKSLGSDSASVQNGLSPHLQQHGQNTTPQHASSRISHTSDSAPDSPSHSLTGNAATNQSHSSVEHTPTHSHSTSQATFQTLESTATTTENTPQASDLQQPEQPTLKSLAQDVITKHNLAPQSPFVENPEALFEKKKAQFANTASSQSNGGSSFSMMSMINSVNNLNSPASTATSTASSQSSSNGSISTTAGTTSTPASPASSGSTKSRPSVSSTSQLPPTFFENKPSGGVGEAFIPPILGAAPLGPVPLQREHQLQFTMLDAAYARLPHPSDTERQRTYLQRMPAKVPEYFKDLQMVNPDSPEFFSRLAVETLFFVFYYMEGTRAQYLAAQALKKQSWRFHTKYMMWFQRHEEPKTINEEYEQGTYIYFDFEKWTQRRKEGFTFEYKFLEDRNLNQDASF